MNHSGFHDRIQELSQLSHGWYNGEGLAPDHLALEKLDRTFAERYDRRLPEPLLYPTQEGNVLLEWFFEHYSISLDIDLSDFTGFFHVLRTDTGEEEEYDLQLDPDLNLPLDGWQTVNDTIRKVGAG